MKHNLNFTLDEQLNILMKFEDSENDIIKDKFVRILWEQLGDICVDEDGLIDTPFYEFPIGTEPTEIWHWFDEKHSHGVAIGLMGL